MCGVELLLCCCAAGAGGAAYSRRKLKKGEKGKKEDGKAKKGDERETYRKNAASGGKGGRKKDGAADLRVRPHHMTAWEEYVREPERRQEEQELKHERRHLGAHDVGKENVLKGGKMDPDDLQRLREFKARTSGL